MFASLAKKTSLVRLVRSISFSNADKTQIEANKKVIGGNLQQRSGEFVYTNENYSTSGCCANGRNLNVNPLGGGGRVLK